MTNWIDVIIKVIFGLIMSVAAVLTTIILSPFMLIMWVIRFVRDIVNGDEQSQ